MALMQRSTTSDSLGLSNLIDTPLHAGPRHDRDIGVGASQHAGALVARATAVIGTFECRGEGHGRFELAGAGWAGEEIGVRGLFGVTA